MAMTELLFFLFTHAVLAQAQPGFISIDCGIPEGSNYTDDETGIFYTSDAGFVQSGENKEYPSSNLVASSLKREYRTVRSFPEGERNCYTVRPVQKGSRYFMRASFAYVHQTEQTKLQGAPEFDLYVGINLWTTVSLRNASDPWWTEILVVAPRDFVPVCLVNTGKGAPFISALEARLVKDSMYTQASTNQSLRALRLLDAGSTSGKIIRYPDDKYDRLWVPYTDPSWASITTSLTVTSDVYLGFEPPSAVMQTAATPPDANASVLYYNWSANDPNTEFHVFRHFADFTKPNGNATLREIDFCNNGHSCFADPAEYLVASTVFTINPMTGVRNNSVSFSKTEKSVLPPILNALEIYVVLSLNQTATDEQDVDAMMSVKDVFGLRKNWMGDPCVPNKYLWDGVTCSYDEENPPRIISLNLSSSGLTGQIDNSFGNLNLILSLDLSKNNLRGPIPLFFSKLTSLAHLDLSENNLTGTVPGFLATLTFLTYLNISQNQFSGSVPMSLVDKSRTGSLTLSVDPNLCNSPSCNSTDPCALKPCKKRRSIAIPVVVAVVVTAVAVTAVTMGIAGFIWFKCRKSKAAARPNINSLSTVNREGGPFFNFETRRFSFDEIVSMTNDFERMLGRGAFGNVYYGQMKNGNEVAVKMLTQNVQASTEFQTEVKLLMTLYHRHLVPFVGYCADGEYRALILEYMARGNLENLLSVQDHEKEILSWDQRVHIALDVAQGLEYLHVFCKPPIIHRDVKAANILLNENLEAKLADFGICKVFTDDHYTHVTTQVRGTHGYLDPEYFNSNNLNEKTDVYGYGVVLLELITGRPAITQITQDDDFDIYKISLVEWVSPFVSAGDIRSIVDPKLQSDYNVGSAWRVLDLAISCTQPKSVGRPSISSVVVQLKECLEVNDYRTDGRTDEFETRSYSSFVCSPR
ncbi:hypothetical protein H6P81_001033 [Aristolochia fimbriata]|uniref:non-specific serine/threonine protein kinase n=1 Tax=Aristolochia fimbriata TaxID=158543 RepID=A0AAV7F5Q7_ARIFI|nr:hypothetical protein H6P81_001033 [Aristolochia fimbriata]